jgi:hypothetical protein
MKILPWRLCKKKKKRTKTPRKQRSSPSWFGWRALYYRKAAR